MGSKKQKGKSQTLDKEKVKSEDIIE